MENIIYIWETERWEVTISEDHWIFKKHYEIHKDEVNKLQSNDWKKNKDNYRKKYNDIISWFNEICDT